MRQDLKPGQTVLIHKPNSPLHNKEVTIEKFDTFGGELGPHWDIVVPGDKDKWCVLEKDEFCIFTHIRAPKVVEHRCVEFLSGVTNGFRFDYRYCTRCGSKHYTK